jgi:hypothetical protein
MIQISLVPVEFVDACWDQVGPHMGKAAKYTYGRYTVDDIYDCIKEYDYQLWVAFEGSKIKGSVVTNIINYPQRRVLCMSFCGGENLKEWKDNMLDTLRRFAKDMGCDGIEATARKGWSKIFKNDGYKGHWVTFELPVQGVNNG